MVVRKLERIAPFSRDRQIQRRKEGKGSAKTLVVPEEMEYNATRARTWQGMQQEYGKHNRLAIGSKFDEQDH